MHPAKRSEPPSRSPTRGRCGRRAPTAIPLLESRDWRSDLDRLESEVSDKTKVLVVNSPHNPTGGVLLTSDLERIAALAIKHDFLVIADEIYSRNFYFDYEFDSIASLPGMQERTIIVDGFSKAYAMTGWRLGYAILPADLAKVATLFNNNTFSCIATFVQDAGIAALTGPDDDVKRMNELFRQRRDHLIEGIICSVESSMPARDVSITRWASFGSS